MLIFDLIMIFGPVAGYVSQYKLIRQTHSVGNFSIDICAILLVANIIRIFFWYTYGFGLPLLFQSILMIIAQIQLLRICVQIKRQQKQQQIQDIDTTTDLQQSQTCYSQFWRWDNFSSYMKFVFILTTSMLILTLIFIKQRIYAISIGYLSTSIEATLALPQLIHNFRSKDVEGISLFLIATWFLGDFGKTLYFIMAAQPIQFIMCGTIQLFIDIIIIIQLIIYSKKGEKYEAVGK